MTKTYELPNEKMIMADVDEKRHTATVHICNAITIDGVVLIKDILDIIDRHITEK